ncbi:MAG: hypothetical protein ACXQTJ_06775 [Candidatus Syntropharchaeales archaeon]
MVKNWQRTRQRRFLRRKFTFLAENATLLAKHGRSNKLTLKRIDETLDEYNGLKDE